MPADKKKSLLWGGGVFAGTLGVAALILALMDALGSGSLAVFATPAMIALMEKTARLSVAPFLEDGQSTVGTLVNVKHLSASPVGMKITCRTELKEIDRRRLVFHVECSDEAGIIGEGEHERFIIDEAKFMAKTEAKLVK